MHNKTIWIHFKCIVNDDIILLSCSPSVYIFVCVPRIFVNSSAPSVTQYLSPLLLIPVLHCHLSVSSYISTSVG